MKKIIITALMLLVPCFFAQNVYAQDNKTIGLPNPLVEYETIEKAAENLDFIVKKPTYIPEGYKMESIGIINKNLFQVILANGDDTLCFRMAKGKDDISGDYNKYPMEKTIEISGIKINVKGDNDKIVLANWVENEIMHSISFSKPVNSEELKLFVDGLQNLKTTVNDVKIRYIKLSDLDKFLK